MEACTSYAIYLSTTIPNVSAKTLWTYLQIWNWGDTAPMIEDVNGDGTLWSVHGTWTSPNPTMNIGSGFQIAMAPDGTTQLFDTMDCVTHPDGQYGDTTHVWLYGCPGCKPATVFHQAGGSSNQRTWGGSQQLISAGQASRVVTGGGATGATGSAGGAGAGATGSGAGEAGATGATGAAAPKGMSTGVMVAIGVVAVGAIGGLVWLMQKQKHARTVGSTREPRMESHPVYTMPLERRLQQPPIVYRAPAAPNRRRRRAA